MYDEWIPELECCDDLSNWTEYVERIYQIFKADFITSKPSLLEKPVNIRRMPIVDDKEDAFFHVTCQDYLHSGNRDPDLRRCERIRWIRSFIEHYESGDLLIWWEPVKNNYRIHMLLDDEQYVVVVEVRENYCLLITAFYIEYEHSLNKLLKRYHQYKAESAPPSETPPETPSTTGR